MTNFSEAQFTVGTSSESSAALNCLVAENGETESGAIIINGVSYNSFTLNDAGAGNFYATTSYRTIRGQECYAVEYTVHSTNIGNYSPDQNISAYDAVTIKSLLESIVQSFKFQ
jgi:hypothetical protein